MEGNLEKKVKMFESKDFIPLFGALHQSDRYRNLRDLKYYVSGATVFLYNTALLLTPIFYVASKLR